MGDMMTNLEILEKGVSYTLGTVMKNNYNMVEKDKITYRELEDMAIDYSSNSIIKVLYSSNGLCNNYTREDNLRYDLANLGDIAIKCELLKNIVNVALFQQNNVEITKVNEEFNKENDIVTNAIIVFNIMIKEGIVKGYKLLENNDILKWATMLFVKYRREGQKEILDKIANSNNVALQMNNEIDKYYQMYS